MLKCCPFLQNCSLISGPSGIYLVRHHICCCCYLKNPSVNSGNAVHMQRSPKNIKKSLSKLLGSFPADFAVPEEHWISASPNSFANSQYSILWNLSNKSSVVSKVISKLQEAVQGRFGFTQNYCTTKSEKSRAFHSSRVKKLLPRINMKNQKCGR